MLDSRSEQSDEMLNSSFSTQDKGETSKKIDNVNIDDEIPF